MKTKLYIMALMAALIYSCQDGLNSNQEEISQDSIQALNIEKRTLRQWFSLNREADSIIASAESMIEKEIDNPRAAKRNKNNVVKAQYHLDRLKQKVAYIKDYEVSIDHFDQDVSHTLDSLKIDYLQEKMRLEAALCELDVYELP
ncbi:hypothetical protein [Flavobacterium sp. HBTb2-11-1]|uniref:hypothetical protein n=1 Tax=Flavobacterium sp. HBTb2-11-1 TaxID=2692212 RepID=UPI00136C1DD2|nr:hypothetical protein [Flavobacterium sp. HBTb2-11-1]MXO06717.1 hypothetical protein [Flavobacterium sp. HBTb2-11-1]